MSGPLTLSIQTMWTSPYVLSCFVTLRVKNVPFEQTPVALHEGEHFGDAFGAMSLTSRVPVLKDGTFAVSESSAIVEYLEERFPAPYHTRVLPADVQDRARARQIMAWIRSDLMPIRTERSSEYVFYPHEQLQPFAPLSEAGERAATKLVRAAERLVPDDGGPIFGGWTIADTDLAMMLQRLHQTAYPLPAKLVTFVEREWEHPAIREFASHPRPPYQASRM